MRHHHQLELEGVELVGRIVVEHVLQHLREPLRIAEIAVIDAGDVGVLLHAGEVEHLPGRRARRRRRQHRAGRSQRADQSAPLFVDHGVVILAGECAHLLTGLSGLISSATRSLICSMVRILLAPNRGMFEHGKAACEL